MITTRTYRNAFIDVKSDEVTETCYNKAQAKLMVENLQKAINDLNSFIDTSND